METVFHIKVVEDDIDHLGHVNYMRYIAFSEKATFDWHRKAGLGPTEMIDENMGTVLVKMEVEYFKEARLGDEVRVYTVPVKLGNKSFVIKQKLYNQHNEYLTEFTKTFVMFNTLSRKGIPVIEKIARQFSWEG